jgi:CRISPR-associated protein Csc2
MDKATEAIQSLLKKESIVHTDFIEDSFTPLLTEVKTLTASEEGVTSILNQANKEAKTYFGKYIEKPDKKEKATNK